MSVGGYNEYGMECSAQYLLNKIQSEKIMETGWRTINDSVWYFAKNGKMLTGLQEIDGVYYFFHPVGQLAISSKEKDPLTGKIYWTDQDGVCTEIEEYILPERDSRFYIENAIKVLSKEQLRLARNEIYARHGRIFTAADLQQYFTEKSWYSPRYEANNNLILNKWYSLFGEIRYYC